MIHYLGEQEKYRSKALWEEAFPEDSKEFRDYYYEEKIKENQILAAEDAGHIVSMLHRNPYVIAAGEQVWNCDYLVAVATVKAKRKQGYMRRLMEKALSDMYREKMPFCFLMPAFKELYLPFGFTYIYDRQKWKLTEAGRKNLTVKPFSKEDKETAAQWMNRWLGTYYQVYTLRSPTYLERLKKEIESEKGELQLLWEHDEIAGVKADWGIDPREQRMLLCAPDYRQEEGKKEPGIMGRILHLPEFVKAIHLKENAEEKELTLCLRIRDRQLEENEGTWLWHLNKTSSCMKKTEEAEASMELKAAAIENTVLSLDISELTSWLMGYSLPEQVRGYGDKIHVLKDVFLDEAV